MGNEISDNTGTKQFKIVLLGDLNVGKSSLAHTFQTGKYNEDYKPPSGTLSYMKSLEIRDNKVELQISEPVNHKRYPYVWPKYVKLSDGVLLLYDVSDLKTLQSLSSLLKRLRKHSSTAIIFLVGMKSDYKEGMQLSHDNAAAFAKKENLEFFECSAKSGENVQYIFEKLALRILQIKNVTPVNEIGVDAMIFEERIILERKESKNANDNLSLIAIEKESFIPKGEEGKCMFRVESNCRDNFTISSIKVSEPETQKYFLEKSKEDTYTQDSDHITMSDVEMSTPILPKEEILVEGKCPTSYF